MSEPTTAASIEFQGQFDPASISVQNDNTDFSCARFTGTEAAWDIIAAQFEDSTLEQTAVFSAAKWGGRAERYLITESGEVAGGAVVVTLSPPIIGPGLAYIKFGPFWRKKGKFSNIRSYGSVIRALTDEICGRQGHLLTILPRPQPLFSPMEASLLSAHGFVIRREQADPNRYLVDLSVDEDQLRRGLKQKWRYNLKKSEKNDLEIVRDEGETGLKAFVDMYRAMLARKRFQNVDNLDLIPVLQDRFPKVFQPKIYFARHQGEAVAGAVICTFGDIAYYVFGASLGSALPLRAGYALHWRIASDFKQEGARWYDLGGEAGEDGLRQFKIGFVGRTGSVLTMAGEYDYWSTPTARIIADGIYGLRTLKRQFYTVG